MSGYSPTPLARKLGYKPGLHVLVINQPAHYVKLLEPLPAGVRFFKRRTAQLDLIHLFTESRRELARRLPDLIEPIRPAGMIWVSWPKKASKVMTDVSEDVIREIALPLGLVDVKVCAVDDVWSALKVVIRKELR